MANPFAPTPIYSGGQLVGISDPIRQQTRLPTGIDKLKYSQPKFQEQDKYSSELLQQSFRSELDLKRAEQEFKAQRGIRDVDIDLPKVDTREVYDPRIGMYVKPDVRGTTQVTRPPTQEERKKIEEASYKGSAGFLGGVVFDKAREGVTKVLETKPVQTTTSYFRDIPLIQEGSILTEDFGFKPKTVGEFILFGTEKATEIGKESQLGFTRASERIFEISEKKEGRKKEWLELGGYVTKGVGFVAGATPKVFQYMGLGVIGGASVDLLATEEKIAKPEKYVQNILDVSYKEYETSYEKARQELPEGYELEQKISRTEFDKEFEQEVRQDVISGFRGEQVVPFALLTGAVALKGYQFATKPLIKTGDGTIKLTTRWRDVLGAKEKYTIRFEDVVPKAKGIAPKFDVLGSPARTLEKGKTTLELYKDIYGYERVVDIGRKTILEKPSLFTSKTRTIFSGDPYSKLGRIQRAEALDVLKSWGLKKDVLRLSRPTIKDKQFRGDVLSITEDGMRVNILKGVTTETYQPEIIGGIKTGMFSGKVERVTSIGVPAKQIPRLDLNLFKETGKIKFTFDWKPTTKTTPFEMGVIKRETVGLTPSAIQKGKVTTFEKFVSETKKVGTARIPTISFKTRDYSVVDLSKPLTIFDVKETGRLLITRKADKFVTTPTKKFTEGEIYKGVSKVGDDLTSARIFVKRGTTPFEPQVKVPKIKSRGRELITGETIKQTEIQTIPFSKVFTTKTKEITPVVFTTTEKTPLIFSTERITTPLIFATSLIQTSESSFRVGTQQVFREETKTEKVFDLVPLKEEAQETRTAQIFSQAQLQKPMEKFKSAQISQLDKLGAMKKVSVTQKINLTPTKRIQIKPKIKPKPEKPIKPIPFKFKGEDKEKKETDEDVIEIFRRIKGEDVKVGEAPTEFLAVQELKKGLRADLSASGFIQKFKTQERIKIKTVGSEFRPSKIEPTRLVQKREKRLGTKQETFQIKQAKKGKKKGGFF